MQAPGPRVKPGHLRAFRWASSADAGLDVLELSELFHPTGYRLFRSQPTLRVGVAVGGFWLMVGYFRTPTRCRFGAPQCTHTTHAHSQLELKPQTPTGPPLHSEPAPGGWTTSSGDESWRCSTRLSTPGSRGLDNTALVRLQLGTEDAFGVGSRGRAVQPERLAGRLFAANKGEGKYRAPVQLWVGRPRWTPCTPSRGSQTPRVLLVSCQTMPGDNGQGRGNTNTKLSRKPFGKLQPRRGRRRVGPGCCSWLALLLLGEGLSVYLADRDLGEERQTTLATERCSKTIEREKLLGSRSFQLGGAGL